MYNMEMFHGVDYQQILAKRGIKLLDTIGRGSYSKVKLGHISKNDPRQVAVKIINLLKAPEDFKESFLPRELENWPSLDHRHVIKFYEAFQIDQTLFMIIEFAPHGDMLKYIQANGNLPEMKRKLLMTQLCNGVKYLHDRDISHRDLKLENLLLDESNSIKITDFGFSKKVSGKNLSHTYCGSKSYAAPEILTGCPYNPFKSDIWAIGIILYIMSTGKFPFDKKKDIKKIIDDYRKLHIFWDRYPIENDCREAVEKLLVFRFQDRPSIDDVFKIKWFITENSVSENA
ncbi:testis-specific serine/threonine-protein kinase 6 [Octopus bimaculoides]|uniref:Protein kinase domain-containing protein n=1 Tax=Octopus bimaculoides TaxID=37653 RepID=A0A0L8GG47_OCTBM|nr:testis-specific serine/threonine-protein kinase 6 [Octopus bimaculoides]|eukprot:XP_014781317.1 PREDICTED: testis-specific serine/threonine-protein kinase 6-like isoform X1 [Octopus bimaculoides]